MVFEACIKNNGSRLFRMQDPAAKLANIKRAMISGLSWMLGEKKILWNIEVYIFHLPITLTFRDTLCSTALLRVLSDHGGNINCTGA